MIGNAKAASRLGAQMKSWNGGHFRFPTIDLGMLVPARLSSLVFGAVVQEFFTFQDIPDNWQYSVIHFGSEYGWDDEDNDIPGDTRTTTTEYVARLGTHTDQGITRNWEMVAPWPTPRVSIRYVRYDPFNGVWGLAAGSFTTNLVNTSVEIVSDTPTELHRKVIYQKGDPPYSDTTMDSETVESPTLVTEISCVMDYFDEPPIMMGSTTDEAEAVMWMNDAPVGYGRADQLTGLEAMNASLAEISFRSNARGVLLTETGIAFINSEDYGGENGQYSQAEIGESLADQGIKVFIGNRSIDYPSGPNFLGCPNLDATNPDYYQPLAEATEGKRYVRLFIDGRMLRNMLVYIDTPYDPLTD